ncbi:MAG: hypothetical protein AAF799_26325 [Myxococcota bacterium]
MIASSLSRVLSLTVAATVCAAPMPAFAATPLPSIAAAPKSDEPATDGKTLALLRFDGGDAANELRATLQTALQDQGYTARGVALDTTTAAKKVKCKAGPDSDECLAAVGKWLNKTPKTAADFIMFGTVGEGAGAEVTIVVYDIAKGERVKTFNTKFNEGDLILPIVLPQQVVTSLNDHREPPPPATAEEQAIIDTLDEPLKTPEEIQAELDAIKKAEEDAARAQQDAVISTDDIEADLVEDFDAFCRKEGEPRKKRESKEDPKDLRPACKRGPFWGYWQPRAWVALGLTTGAALGAATMYTLALVGRGPYGDAVDALDAYNAQANGDPRRDPNAAAGGYDALATEVSRTGAIVQRRAIVGDVLLGTSVLLGGVLAIIIYQDRNDAKNFIKEEKSIRAISDVRVGPILTRDTQGVGFGFRF